MMNSVRPSAVSGMFYPGEKQEISDFFAECKNVSLLKKTPSDAVPRALILPHAGYIYSGSVAASAYTQLIPIREQIQRVVLLGPAHRVGWAPRGSHRSGSRTAIRSRLPFPASARWRTRSRRSSRVPSPAHCRLLAAHRHDAAARGHGDLLQR